MKAITKVRRIAKTYGLKIKTQSYSFGRSIWAEDVEGKYSSGCCIPVKEKNAMDFRHSMVLLAEDLSCNLTGDEIQSLKADYYGFDSLLNYGSKLR